MYISFNHVCSIYHRGLPILKKALNICLTLGILISLGCAPKFAIVPRDINLQLIQASLIGDTGKVTELLEQGAKVNARSGLVGTTPLISAVRGGYVEVARILLENGADDSIIDSFGDTAHIAAVRARDASREEHVKAIYEEILILLKQY